MSTKPLMPLAGRIKFTEGEPYEDGSLGKKLKDIDDSVANETSDRQYADAVIQNQLNEETLHLVPDYISNANTFFTAGAGKTNTATTGLPPEVSAYEHDKWGTIFYLPENEEEHTGTQIYHCIAYNGSPNRGKIYKRLIISGVPTAWELVGAGSGGNVTTIVETIDDAPENPQIGDRITVLQDDSTDSVPMSAVIGLINALDGKQNLLPFGTNNGDILVWDASQNKYVSKPKWQMIYQPVEYIEATGTECIDTGVIPYLTDDFEIEIEAAYKGQSSPSSVECLLGSAKPTPYPAEYYQFDKFLTEDSFRLLEGSSVDGNVEMFFEQHDYSDKRTYKLNGKSLYIDGTKVTESPASTIPTYTVSIYLFARHNTLGNDQFGHWRIYSCKIKHGGVYIRDYIPVYNIYTGEVGMFDTVEGKFYGNKGSGTFLKGADI